MAQTPQPLSTAPARLLQAPDSYPFVGLPGTAWEDGTLLVNQDSGELYFWNVNSAGNSTTTPGGPPDPNNKWDPLS